MREIKVLRPGICACLTAITDLQLRRLEVTSLVCRCSISIITHM
jgi:hypothetical protein